VDEAVFYFDFNSPYAYLAAARVDELMPVPVRWEPIALAFLLRARDRVPWSMREDTRGPGMEDCERRAREYGLPPLRWPPGWPVESYSLGPLRAARVAAEHGRLREFSRAAFARNFVHGTGLRASSDVLEVAAEAGLDPELVSRGMSADPVKEALRQATEAAIAMGVIGVPTTVVASELFWGDDQLEAAAAAARAT
jgi:2-hydroxychromene-2-carboxylate isomerase